MMSSKINPGHLDRSAFIYVRQSTMDQVINNKESQRRQYALKQRARDLGWKDVQVIDDDLGRSGGGIERPGFDRLLAAVGRNEVGAVLAIEASRLSRNGRDWHTLLDICALVDTLIIDEEGMYSARSPNDRLLLGMKGTMSEMELSMFRQRSQEALKLKASRGELFTSVAIGYIRSDENRLNKDPDQRVQVAISQVFEKFRQLGSARQVLMRLRENHIEMPAIRYADQGREVIWKLPVYNTIWHLLTNPVYSGVYAYGRSHSKVSVEDGRKHVVRGLKVDTDDWQVLLHEQHESYITWAEYESNQKILANNANRMGDRVTGSARSGKALVAGLLRCGHCGRKLHVHYSGKGGSVTRYGCRGASVNHGVGTCISFGGIRVDQAVSNELLRVLRPIGLNASLLAEQKCRQQTQSEREQYEKALEQAQYEASRLQRQYDRVEPENRLVATELERRWNESLDIAAQRQRQLEKYDTERTESISEEQRALLISLATDLEKVWHDPLSDMQLKKRIVRTVLKEIVVKVADDTLQLHLHWIGGDHTSLCVTKNRTGKHRFTSSEDTVHLIEQLARQIPDQLIAATLNRLGRKTGKGNGWSESRVRSCRQKRKINVYKKGERATRGELTLEEAAQSLELPQRFVRSLIDNGTLKAQQACPGAPWVILMTDIELTRQNRDKLSPSQDSGPQKSLEFQ